MNRAIWNGDTEAYSGGVGVRYKAFFNGQISDERGTSFVQRGRDAAAPIRVGAALARDNANGWSWRDYQLLHGAARQIGNVAVNGVVFADVHGVNWRLDLGQMHAVQNQLTDNSVSFNIPISRFGHWTTNPATAPTALMVSIAYMGQSTPALTVGPKTIFTGGPGDPFEPDRADLYRCRLYVCDITPRGDKVLLAYGGLWYGCDTPESQVYLVHPRPLAFIELRFF